MIHIPKDQHQSITHPSMSKMEKPYQCSLTHLPWLLLVRSCPRNWPRAPWQVEPLYFRSVYIAHSSWEEQERRLACARLLIRFWANIRATFSPASPFPFANQEYFGVLPSAPSSWGFFFFFSTCSPTASSSWLGCVFALIERRYRLLSISLPSQNKLQLRLSRRSVFRITPQAPRSSYRLPQHKALTGRRTNRRWRPCADRLRQASKRAARRLILPTAVPLPLQSPLPNEVWSRGRAAKWPSGAVCYHWQTAIAFQNEDAGAPR